MKTLLVCIGLAVLLAACASKPPAGKAESGSEGKQVSSQERDVDPLVEGILAGACKLVAKASTLKFRADIDYDALLPTGQMMEYSRRADVQFRRPNDLRIDEVNDRGEQRLFYDGEALHMAAVQEQVFVKAPGHGSLENMMGWLAKQYGFSSPLGDLLVADPCKNLMSSVRIASYGGSHYLPDGGSYHHLLFRAEKVDFQIWVKTDPERPVIRKLAIDYRDLPGAPRYVAHLSGWTFGAAIPAETFRFKQPAGAEELEFQAPDAMSSPGAISAQ